MIEKFKKFLIPIVIIIVLMVAGVFIFLNQEKVKETSSPQEIAEGVINYINDINNNMLPEGLTASLLDVEEENGLYKIHIKIAEEEYYSYATKDGKLFFPQSIDLEEIQTKAPEETELVEETPPIEEESSLEALAKCLSEKGVKLYGTYGCGYCKKQKEMFGEAAKYLPYIECVDEKTRHICEEAEIGPVPTWDFPDGKRVLGLQSLEKLAELSGCSL